MYFICSFIVFFELIVLPMRLEFDVMVEIFVLFTLIVYVTDVVSGNFDLFDVMYKQHHL